MNQEQYESPDFIEQCTQKAALHFGVKALRSSQVDVLKLLPQHSHVLATLPTGAGKTLIYALPALVLPQKPVVVISPLIALMRDQVRRMDEAHIPSVLLTSEQDESERRDSYSKIFSSQTKLIFVSPERLALYSFRQLLKRVAPKMVVVDEAHCIATWGIGFRPEYGQLGLFLKDIQPEKVLALTATAGNATRRTIRHVLFGAETKGAEYVSRPLRPHIFLESRRCFSEKEKFDALSLLLERQGNGKSIVYFPTRKQCEDNARVLRQAGFRAMVYHAGLTRQQRKSVEQYVQESLSEKIVICATQAFGMGMDVGGVDLVCVYGFASSIEDFYQMVGRAGRQGEPSRGILIWNGSDPKRRSFLFSKNYPEYEEVQYAITKVTPYFPGKNRKALVLQSDIEGLLKYSSRSKDLSNGVLQALRIMGAIELPPYNDALLEVCLAKDASIASMAATLPKGKTMRSLFLSAIEHISPGVSRLAEGLRLVMPLRTLCLEARLSYESLHSVLQHFAQETGLRYRETLPGERAKYFVICDDMATAQSKLKDYIRLRNELFQGLRQLEVLAMGRQCRLKESFPFFGVPAPRARAVGCGQCDVCLEQFGSLHNIQRWRKFLEIPKEVTPSV